MDFDDPIGDLLSEGSNDSFFEDPKVLTKKSTPKKTTSKAAADIFGLKDNITTKTNETTINDDWLGLSPKKDSKGEVDLKSKKSENVTFETDDVASLLGTTTEQKRTSKKSILSELLDDKHENKKTSFDDILQSSTRKKETTVASSSVNIIEPKSKPQSQTEYTPVLGRESRRTRRNSPSIIDPLGLFDSEPKETKASTLKKDVETTKPLDGKKSISQTIVTEPKPNITTNKSKSLEILPNNPIHSESTKVGLPDWLSNTKQKQKSEPANVVKEIETTVQNVTDISQKQTIPDNMIESVLTQQKIASSHLELQNASIALQQQESQLMVALQLKKYEEKLMGMQRKQEDMLVKQDIQFNSLLEKQFSKQQLIENTMRLQQERINNHIQLLMSQPGSSISADIVQEKQQKNDYLKSTLEEHKKFYDDIVTSLKQKHQEEVFLLEESYKKQLIFLENSLESTEKRLQFEIDNINKYYNIKLEELNNEKEAIILKYEDKIKQTQETNKTEMEIIKDSYKNTVEDVRNEYKLMLQDVSKQKLKENELTEQSELYNLKLNENIETLNTNAKSINDLRTKLSDEYKMLGNMKTESINAKELEIKMMHSTLEKQRIANDDERAQMLALIKTLQTRLVEQTQIAREERWTFQQATATLAARSLALDRESDFVKSNLEREREQIKTLKETLLAEHEVMILKLTEEKLTLAAEKSKLEASSKLSKNFDNAKAQVEIEAAIKVAREATEMTDKERENLCRQQSELEILKRNIQDQQNQLLVKEKHSENMLKTAKLKYRDGEKALIEAREIEYKYNEKLRDIQKQLLFLADREKKLTEEKILLSKERLSIHNTLKENKKCSLCEADNYKSDYELRKQQTEVNTRWNTDVEILRLRYDLQNELDASKHVTIPENDSDN